MGQRREAEAVVALIREHGVYGLAGSDGCRCGNFTLQTFHVDVSCHKSSGAVPWHRWGVIRVYNHHLYTGMGDLRLVADEVERQLFDPQWDGEYGESYFVTRFCEWSQDKDQSCVYCARPRQNQRGYLCVDCLTRDDGKIAAEYDFRRIEASQNASVEASR